MCIFAFKVIYGATSQSSWLERGLYYVGYAAGVWIVKKLINALGKTAVALPYLSDVH